MGYYTDFELNVHPKRNGIFFNREMIAAIEDAIDKLEIFECGSFADGAWYGNAKWYDYSRDMIALSTQFPDALFELSGKGEEFGDFWVAYFCEGRSQFCHGEIVYEEPDMKTLVGADADDTDVKVDDTQIDSLLEAV